MSKSVEVPSKISTVPWNECGSPWNFHMSHSQTCPHIPLSCPVPLSHGQDCPCVSSWGIPSNPSGYLETVWTMHRGIPRMHIFSTYVFLFELEGILLKTKKFTCESCSTKLPGLHPFSITHYWVLIIILIPCLLVLFSLWCAAYTLWCMLVCRNLVKLHLYRLKSNFG